jgi:histidyl-tRNA synthetase
MGLERLVAMLADLDYPGVQTAPAVYLVAVGEDTDLEALALAELLRDLLPGLRVEQHCGGGSFKSQLRRADRRGAKYAVILGEREVAEKCVGLKSLRSDAPQESLSWPELIKRLQSELDSD